MGKVKDMSETSTIDLVIEFLEVMARELRRIREEKQKPKNDGNTLEIKVQEEIGIEESLK